MFHFVASIGDSHSSIRRYSRRTERQVKRGPLLARDIAQLLSKG